MTPEHAHKWELARSESGSVFVIDTFPEQLPYVCECGAFTHHPETGEPCRGCAPTDYAQRGPTVLLKGGPFDGKRITRPVNYSVTFRCGEVDERMRTEKYEQSENDPDVWDYGGWSVVVPFVERD